MNYDDVSNKSYRALGVDLICHRKAGGWTEIVATGPYTDAPTIFDHSAFDPATAARELRNALRRHARWVKRQLSESL